MSKSAVSYETGANAPGPGPDWVGSGPEANGRSVDISEASNAMPADPARPTIIRPRSRSRLLDLDELWRFRELLGYLAWRDITIRYKQTFLGATWAILQPLATMLVFTLVFGRMAAAPDSPIPYPLFVLAGMIPWTFFATAITTAGMSLIGNERLVTKIYFPRLLLPMGSVAAVLVDLCIALGLLVVAMVICSVTPGIGILVLPLLIFGLLIAALGVGTLLAALTVSYRDFKHVVPFMIQLWLFLTPTIYLQGVSPIGPRWQWLLSLNPAYGLIDNFRRAIFGEALDLTTLAPALAVSVGLLVVGVLYFRRVECEFADII